MSKKSKIANKTHTTLSINRELLAIAKEKGINMSLLLDAALERELNPECKEAYHKAIEKKLDLIHAWMKDKPRSEEDYYKYLGEKTKGGEVNVLEKKERRNIGEI